MRTKTVEMPLPTEAVGGEGLKVVDKSANFVSTSMKEAFEMFFSESDSVKCIFFKANGVLNLQFIGNGCVANMQMYEVRSEDALEAYIHHKAVIKNINCKKGGLA